MPFESRPLILLAPVPLLINLVRLNQTDQMRHGLLRLPFALSIPNAFPPATPRAPPLICLPSFPPASLSSAIPTIVPTAPIPHLSLILPPSLQPSATQRPLCLVTWTPLISPFSKSMECPVLQSSKWRKLVYQPVLTTNRRRLIDIHHPINPSVSGSFCLLAQLAIISHLASGISISLLNSAKATTKPRYWLPDEATGRDRPVRITASPGPQPGPWAGPLAMGLDKRTQTPHRLIRAGPTPTRLRSRRSRVRVASRQQKTRRPGRQRLHTGLEAKVDSDVNPAGNAMPPSTACLRVADTGLHVFPLTGCPADLAVGVVSVSTVCRLYTMTDRHTDRQTDRHRHRLTFGQAGWHNDEAEMKHSFQKAHQRTLCPFSKNSSLQAVKCP
ncbi:unnamed protein product [Protopolystoma xenopodis]|uniref:Uncharacterized protein n=1 Tax=Protopolystoma xenopodis TaxID=117903 RepID=A0A448WM31_9PLAT|nr:unnamed protein product [Protopolystoma xenopodis]